MVERTTFRGRSDEAKLAVEQPMNALHDLVNQSSAIPRMVIEDANDIH
jgi:hypothetical protein